MNILGLYLGHDSSFCLVKDGQICRHFETEHAVHRLFPRL